MVRATTCATCRCWIASDASGEGAGGSPPLTLSANALYVGQVVTWAATKLPHYIGEFSTGTNPSRGSIMLRMVFLGLLIPLGVGVLAAMEPFPLDSATWQ